MDKRALLVPFFMVMAMGLSAQDKGYLSVALGYAVPMGVFGDNDITAEEAGLAREGLLLEIAGAYHFVPKFGLALSIRGVANPVDAQVLADNVASSLGGTARVEAQPWSASSFLLGGSAIFPLSEGNGLELRAMAGSAIAKTPELKIDAGGTTFRELSVDSYTFTYLIGAGFRFAVGRKIALFGNLDYQAMNPRFEGAVVTGGGLSEELPPFEQPMSWMNLSFGLALRL